MIKLRDIRSIIKLAGKKLKHKDKNEIYFIENINVLHSRWTLKNKYHIVDRNFKTILSGYEDEIMKELLNFYVVGDING